MKNLNKTFKPLDDSGDGSGFYGLTKREIFCLHNGVPDTGDEQLDGIIRKGNRQKAALAAMQGILADGGDFVEFSDMAYDSVRLADALLAELEKE